jgi:hypothetical protein
LIGRANGGKADASNNDSLGAAMISTVTVLLPTEVK